jgi:hypothetical protein
MSQNVEAFVGVRLGRSQEKIKMKSKEVSVA